MGLVNIGFGEHLPATETVGAMYKTQMLHFSNSHTGTFGAMLHVSNSHTGTVGATLHFSNSHAGGFTNQKMVPGTKKWSREPKKQRLH